MDVRDRYLCTTDRDWHRVGYPTSDNYSWIELRPRPLTDGHHESGFRYLSLTGAWDSEDGIQREDLHQWADHVMLYGVVNIDVELDGTIRLMCWGPKQSWECNERPDFYPSSAMFYPSDFDNTIALLTTYKEIRKK